MDTTRTEPHLVATRLQYDRKGAAAQLSISIRSLDYLIANKKLATRRLGRKVMVTYAELVRFTRSNHYEDMSNESVDNAGESVDKAA
jgi:hypothetical protein